MSRLSMLALAFVFVAIPVSRNLAAEEAKSKTSEVMVKYFKGKESPVQHAIAGTADDATLKAMVEAFLTLNGEKPPQGDVEVWKKKTTALSDAAKALQEKKLGAADAFKEAADCKACHSVFRPKKP